MTTSDIDRLRYKVRRPSWVETEHPRDRVGRWIEKFALVRMWGGVGGRVLRNVGGGRIEIQREDGSRAIVHRNYLTVVARPDGSAPTNSRDDDPAPLAEEAPSPDAVEVPVPTASPAVDPVRASAGLDDVLDTIDPAMAERVRQAARDYTEALANGVPDDEADERDGLISTLDAVERRYGDEVDVREAAAQLRAAAEAEPPAAVPDRPAGERVGVGMLRPGDVVEVDGRRRTVEQVRQFTSTGDDWTYSVEFTDGGDTEQTQFVRVGHDEQAARQAAFNARADAEETAARAPELSPGDRVHGTVSGQDVTGYVTGFDGDYVLVDIAAGPREFVGVQGMPIPRAEVTTDQQMAARMKPERVVVNTAPDGSRLVFDPSDRPMADAWSIEGPDGTELSRGDETAIRTEFGRRLVPRADDTPLPDLPEPLDAGAGDAQAGFTSEEQLRAHLRSVGHLRDARKVEQQAADPMLALSDAGRLFVHRNTDGTRRWTIASTWDGTPLPGSYGTRQEALDVAGIIEQTVDSDGQPFPFHRREARELVGGWVDAAGRSMRKLLGQASDAVRATNTRDEDWTDEWARDLLGLPTPAREVSPERVSATDLNPGDVIDLPQLGRATVVDVQPRPRGGHSLTLNRGEGTEPWVATMLTRDKATRVAVADAAQAGRDRMRQREAATVEPVPGVPAHVVEALAQTTHRAPQAIYSRNRGDDVPEGYELWRTSLPEWGVNNPQWLVFRQTDAGPQLIGQDANRGRALELGRRAAEVMDRPAPAPTPEDVQAEADRADRQQAAQAFSPGDRVAVGPVFRNRIGDGPLEVDRVLSSGYVRVRNLDTGRTTDLAPSWLSRTTADAPPRIAVGDRVRMPNGTTGRVTEVRPDGTASVIFRSGRSNRQWDGPTTRLEPAGAVPFKKGDRVTVTKPGDYQGRSGVVQQSRSGGTVAIVRLDDGSRVSIYQSDLEAERPAPEPEPEPAAAPTPAQAAGLGDRPRGEWYDTDDGGSTYVDEAGGYAMVYPDPEVPSRYFIDVVYADGSTEDDFRDEPDMAQLLAEDMLANGPQAPAAEPARALTPTTPDETAPVEARNIRPGDIIRVWDVDRRTNTRTGQSDYRVRSSEQAEAGWHITASAVDGSGRQINMPGLAPHSYISHVSGPPEPRETPGEIIFGTVTDQGIERQPLPPELGGEEQRPTPSRQEVASEIAQVAGSPALSNFDTGRLVAAYLNPRVAATDGMYPAEALKYLRAHRNPRLLPMVLAAAAGSQGSRWDGARARAALDRYNAGDPSLPASSIGHRVEITELDPDRPSRRRVVSGVVEDVEASSPVGSVYVIVRGDDGVRRSQRFDADAHLGVVDTAEDIIRRQSAAEPEPVLGPPERERRVVYQATSTSTQDPDEEPDPRDIEPLLGSFVRLRMYNDNGVATEYLAGRFTDVDADEAEFLPEGADESFPIRLADVYEIAREVEPTADPSQGRLFPAADQPAAPEAAAPAGEVEPTETRAPQPTRPDPGWGEPWGGELPSYFTPDGPVWMFRRGQRVRFYDSDGEQVGPEQANVAPAGAYARQQGWTATADGERGAAAVRAWQAEATEPEAPEPAPMAEGEPGPVRDTTVNVGGRDYRTDAEGYSEQLGAYVYRDERLGLFTVPGRGDEFGAAEAGEPWNLGEITAQSTTAQARKRGLARVLRNAAGEHNTARASALTWAASLLTDTGWRDGGTMDAQGRELAELSPEVLRATDRTRADLDARVQAIVELAEELDRRDFGGIRTARSGGQDPQMSEALRTFATAYRTRRAELVDSLESDAKPVYSTGQEEGPRDGQAGTDRGEPLPPVSAAGVSADSEPGGVLRRPRDGDGQPDRGTERPPRGPRPRRGDVRAESEPTAGGPVDGRGTGATGQPAGTAAPDAAAEPGGPGLRAGDSGVSGGGSGVGAAAPPVEVERPDDAGVAAPGVTGDDQPAPNEAEVNAAAAAAAGGASFRPRSMDDLAPAGKVGKLNANMAALRLLRQLQAEQRPATADEQAVLARWAGWGGLPEVFDARKPQFAAEREELRGLLSESEWREASRNTLNAHYTDARVVSAMWQAVQDLGFDGGRVLEPGSGSGTFIGMAPPEAEMIGVELDSTTAAISQYLYPDAVIRNEGFERTNVPDGTFDLTVGNVPFGDFPLADRRHNPGRAENIHNHFILKSLALTRPGGLVAVLSSRYTMDAQNPRARQKMAELGDLVGAVRLPTGSHQRASGTDVIEDILIFRRRGEGEEPQADQSWVQSSRQDLDGFEVTVNPYWDAHPENVLGRMQGVRGQYGGDVRVVGDRNMTDLPAVLAGVVADARADGLTATATGPREAMPELIGADITRHEGHIRVEPDGTFTQANGGVSVPFEVPGTQVAELSALVGMRDTLSALLDAESRDAEDTPEIQALRAQLNRQYDDYVDTYGPINRFKLTKAGARNPPKQGNFRRDPMSAIVRALESYNPSDGTATKTSIFTQRSVAPRTPRTTADNPADALTLSMDTYGEINMPAIAKMLDTDEASAREQLGDLVFEVPPVSDDEAERVLEAARAFVADGEEPPDLGALVSPGVAEAAGSIEPAAAYLSGNVRRKLAVARAAAARDPRFRANVAALEAVVPVDLGTDEIDGRLGAAWIDAATVEEFVKELVEDRYGQVKVAHSGGNIWTVEGPNWGNLATEVWGTDRRSASQIVQALLEQRAIRVGDTVDGKNVPNLDATVAAQEKAEQIQERFAEWLWEDPERSRRLQQQYNERFNSIALRTYDGSGRAFPDMSTEWQEKVHGHVKDAVERIVNEPTALLAHVVGAGKTAEMVMGAGELRRLGLARKPAIVIPNHMLEQFTREYLEIYPQAKLLAASTADLRGDRRREFVARAATGDWDAVILTQDAFEAIPMSQEQQEAYIARELATMRAQLEEAQSSDRGDKAQEKTVKKMERALINAENALRAKMEKTKDVGVTFEQTGIDYLMVDEAHEYSNLRTLSHIQGAATVGSDMATDLHMKMEYLRANTRSGRVATFASGTPIRNTVTQAYIMQRYLRPDLLEEAGITSFDQWAATFGSLVDEMELKPEGNGFRQTTRFAKFRNVPELLRMFHTFADVMMAEDLNLPTPPLIGDKAEIVSVPPSEALTAYIRDLGRRAEDVRNRVVTPQEDNMLKVSTDGRKAALSMKLVGGEHESGKIEVAADRISAIYEQNKDRVYLDPKTGTPDPVPGAFQIVFADMGTPKAQGRKAGDADFDTVEEATSVEGWNAYDTLKEELVARGVPAEKIRYIHEAKNDAERGEMFAAARSGAISVLIGSSQKMGVGTNMQRRAVAMHHLDAPWRPSDVEQRDGRIMRQGNLNTDGVQVLRYVTEGSFDAYMWQTLTRKAKFINQIMRGSLDVREIEDIGDTAFSYAEVMATATGNPDFLDKAKVDTRVNKLERLARTHARTQTNLIRDVERQGLSAAVYESNAAALDRAIAARVPTRGEAFSMTVNGERFAKRADAAELFKAQLENALDRDYWGDGPERDVGSIGGQRVIAQVRPRPQGGRQVILRFADVPGDIARLSRADVDSGGVGLITRLENGLESFERRRDNNLEAAAGARVEVERMQQRIGTLFGAADELEALRAKQARLNLKIERDAKRADGEAVPFDPMIDTDRYDHPSLRGDSDEPLDPNAEVEVLAPVPVAELDKGDSIEVVTNEATGMSVRAQVTALEPGVNTITVVFRTPTGEDYSRTYERDAMVPKFGALTGADLARIAEARARAGDAGGVKALAVVGDRVLVLTTKARRSHYREEEHPRDRYGRWIETGQSVRIWGGGTGTIVGDAPGDRVQVRRASGDTVTVDADLITVTHSPGGTPATPGRAPTGGRAPAGRAPAAPPAARPRATPPTGGRRAPLGDRAGASATARPAGPQLPAVQPTPRQMQDAEDVLGAERTEEIVGPGGLSGATPEQARQLVTEAERERVAAGGTAGAPAPPKSVEPAPDATPDGAFRTLSGPEGERAWLRTDEGEDPVGFLQTDPDDPSSTVKFTDPKEWVTEVDGLGLREDDSGFEPSPAGVGGLVDRAPADLSDDELAAGVDEAEGQELRDTAEAFRAEQARRTAAGGGVGDLDDPASMTDAQLASAAQTLDSDAPHQEDQFEAVMAEIYRRRTATGGGGEAEAGAGGGEAGGGEAGEAGGGEAGGAPNVSKPFSTERDFQQAHAEVLAGVARERGKPNNLDFHGAVSQEAGAIVMDVREGDRWVPGPDTNAAMLERVRAGDGEFRLRAGTTPPTAERPADPALTGRRVQDARGRTGTIRSEPEGGSYGGWPDSPKVTVEWDGGESTSSPLDQLRPAAPAGGGGGRRGGLGEGGAPEDYDEDGPRVPGAVRMDDDGGRPFAATGGDEGELPEGITLEDNQGISVVRDNGQILGNIWQNDDGSWSANGEPAIDRADAIGILRSDTAPDTPEGFEMPGEGGGGEAEVPEGFDATSYRRFSATMSETTDQEMADYVANAQAYALPAHVVAEYRRELARRGVEAPGEGGGGAAGAALPDVGQRVQSRTGATGTVVGTPTADNVEVEWDGGLRSMVPRVDIGEQVSVVGEGGAPAAPPATVVPERPDPAAIAQARRKELAKIADTAAALEAIDLDTAKPQNVADVGAPLRPEVLKDFNDAEGAGGSALPHLVTGPDGEVTFSPERQQLHARIVAHILDAHESQENPRYHVMGGGPAAGKSTMEKALPEIGEGQALLNADDIKAMLPEYGQMVEAGNPGAANHTHEESSYLAKLVQAEAFGRKVNVTLDGTGDSKAAKMRGKIDAARAAGYSVHGFYVSIPTDEAVRRAKARAAKTGRDVPETVIRETHVAVSVTLPEIVDGFDSVVLYDTSVNPRDAPPAKVVSKAVGGELEVHDRELYDRFLAKATESIEATETDEPLADVASMSTADLQAALASATGARAAEIRAELRARGL